MTGIIARFRCCVVTLALRAVCVVFQGGMSRVSLCKIQSAYNGPRRRGVGEGSEPAKDETDFLKPSAQMIYPEDARIAELQAEQDVLNRELDAVKQQIAAQEARKAEIDDVNRQLQECDRDEAAVETAIALQLQRNAEMEEFLSQHSMEEARELLREVGASLRCCVLRAQTVCDAVSVMMTTSWCCPCFRS